MAYRTALVTGASRGLGRNIAGELAKLGLRVGLLARPSPDLESAVAEILAQGGEAVKLEWDLGQGNSLSPLLEKVASELGVVDLLVHNASYLGRSPLRLLSDTQPQDFEQVLQTNLINPFRLSQALVANMSVRGHGRVAAISSDAAVEAYAHWGGYSVSKAAHDHLLAIWAQELSPFGVDVVSVDPGEMNTAMHRAALPDADESLLADPKQIGVELAQAFANSNVTYGGARFEKAKLLQVGGAQ